MVPVKKKPNSLFPRSHRRSGFLYSSANCCYSVRCPFSEYKSSDCPVGKESVYIYVCVCVCTCVRVYWTISQVGENSFCHVNSSVVPGKRGRIHFFLSLTAGPSFGILPPADLTGSVQPIYFRAGIRLPVGNKSNSSYRLTPYSFSYTYLFG